MKKDRLHKNSADPASTINNHRSPRNHTHLLQPLERRLAIDQSIIRPDQRPPLEVLRAGDMSALRFAEERRAVPLLDRSIVEDGGGSALPCLIDRAPVGAKAGLELKEQLLRFAVGDGERRLGALG